MINDVHYNDFYSSNANRQITITYSGGTLTNSDIAGTDGFKLIERICSERQLVFGSVGSAELRLKLLDTSEFSYIDEDLTVSLVTNGDALNPFNFGSYKVVTDKPNRSGYYRELVAYDALYDVLNADYSSWYNGLTFPMTLKQFRDSFFTQIGITQETTTLPNDTMTVTKTITPTTLSGKDILFAINEVNGRFGHLNRNGQYRYVKLISIVEGLYPADDLYPEDTLYPADENTTPVGGAHVILANYESAYSDYISKLIIRNSDDSIGATIGSGVNEYVVQNNFLLYDKSAADLNTIGTTLYNEIALAYYQAATMKVVGNPCFELGDAYNATCKQTVVRSYILERTLVGIQGMTDTYVSHGELTLNNNSNVLQSQIQRLNGRTHEIINTVDEHTEKITNVEGDVSIVSQKANVIYAAVFNDQSQSRITINANAISQEVSDRQGAVSAVWTTVNGINAHYISDTGNYNGVTINSNGIQCVGDGAFTVDMTNLEIDSNGNITLTGTVTATSGTFTGTIHAAEGGTLGRLHIGSAGLWDDYSGYIIQAGEGVSYIGNTNFQLEIRGTTIVVNGTVSCNSNVEVGSLNIGEYAISWKSKDTLQATDLVLIATRSI